MDLIQLIIVSIIQGITEFLPISSSAHLVLLPQLMGWKDQGLAIDVAAHLGSLFAVVFYFRKDFRDLLIGGLRSISNYNFTEINSKLFWLIILASVPAITVGYIFREIISHYMRDPLVISFATIFFGIILLLSDFFGKHHRNIKSINKTNCNIFVMTTKLLYFIYRGFFSWSLSLTCFGLRMVEPISVIIFL